MTCAVNALTADLARAKALDTVGQVAKSLEVANTLTAKVGAAAYNPLSAAYLATLGAAKRSRAVLVRNRDCPVGKGPWPDAKHIRNEP